MKQVYSYLVQRIYQRVMYVQKVVRFFSTCVNIILFTSIRKSEPSTCRSEKTHKCWPPLESDFLYRTKHKLENNVKYSEKNILTPLSKLCFQLGRLLRNSLPATWQMLWAYYIISRIYEERKKRATFFFFYVLT